MLAGYLPFDDDPANPEGDNINLLYKYIVNTPLTFPEYVTPHARDLLRRILVPNPRKRADLFEVARHSWLSDYAHVVELITSCTTTPSEIQNTTVAADDEGGETPMVARSSSVRESSKKAAAAPALGGLASKQGTIDSDADAAAFIRQQKDAKRRTVQVEYVAPTTQTQRGEVSGSQPAGGKTRARSGSQGPVEVAVDSGPVSPQDKPLPRDPPVSKTAYTKNVVSKRPPSAHHNNGASSRTNRDGTRVPSESAYLATVSGNSGARPATGGSMKSTGSRFGAGGRASYGQPLPPEIADTNVHGRIQQPPKGASGSYNISNPIPQDRTESDYGRPSISVPSKFERVAGEGGAGEAKGHKRSNTIGELGGKIFGRSGSIFGKNRKRSEQQQTGEKTKRYPPVSMNHSFAAADESRQSMDSKQSRRSFSVGLGKKRSGSISGSQASQEKQHTRRFSLIPAGFSLKAIGIGKDYGSPPPTEDSRQDLPVQEMAQVDQYGQYVNQNIGAGQVDANTLDGMYAQLQDPVPAEYQPAPQQRFAPQDQQFVGRPSGRNSYVPSGAVPNTGSESSVDNMRRPPGSAPHPQQYTQHETQDGRRIVSTSRSNRGVLQKNRRFVDAWDTDESARAHDHSGSSGPARKVMDFFRRRGKARGGEDR